MRSRLFNQMKTVVILATIFSAFCADQIQAQHSTRNKPSPRDVVREIQRVDREQLLLLTPLPPGKSDGARLALLKKIKEDFKTLQNVNNKMMSEVFASDQLDYGHTSDMISQVRAKAVSLKTNLALPTDNNAKKPPSPNAIDSLKDLRAALLVLDQSVMSFVNNPMFQKPDVVEISLATKASRDLEAVISLSGDLKKLTARLESQSNRKP
jgi:hypothetical protein